MLQSPFPTQTPLNLIMPIKPGSAPALRALLTGVSARQDKPVERALVGLGNVHHVEHIGGIFNAILQYVYGAEALIPVETHRDTFLAFIAAHDHKCLHAFSAYPGRRLFDIKDALGI